MLGQRPRQIKGKRRFIGVSQSVENTSFGGLHVRVEKMQSSEAGKWKVIFFSKTIFRATSCRVRGATIASTATPSRAQDLLAVNNAGQCAGVSLNEGTGRFEAFRQEKGKRTMLRTMIA
jgi:hypothetical protein